MQFLITLKCSYYGFFKSDFLKDQMTSVLREYECQSNAVIRYENPQYRQGFSVLIQYQKQSTMSLANILTTEHTGSTKQLPSLQPGTRKKLEHFSYALNEIIGKGYSSQVFKGKNDLSSEPVAIKVIDMKMLKCEVNRTLLNNEIENLKQLSFTPSVLQLYEVYNTKNNTYIITELCDSDLSKRIKKKLGEGESAGYIQQLINGYLHLWRKEIIHRDLKPANILMKEGVLKIADFGFSINAKQALRPSKYNVGSPLYMAPESLRRNQYSFKSDIWALGVIYFQMVFGHPPWRAKNEKELLKKIETENIAALLNGPISPQSRQFLIRCLALDKNERLGPEDLQRFNFISVPTICELTPKPFKEKIMNEKVINQKINQTIFYQQPEPILDSSPKLYQQENREVAKSIDIRDKDKVNRENIKKKVVVVEGDDLLTREERKDISRMLISEVHFCRFLFKLGQRIRGQKGLEGFDEVLKEYSAIIMHKIVNVKDFENFNFISTPLYEQYKQCNDFNKIRKIGKEYYIRYSQQLPESLIGNRYDIPQAIKTTADYINTLSSKLTQLANNDNIGMYTGEIIVLDYLVTTYQLLGLIKDKEDYCRFAKKSKIEEIVEGSPTSITINHFQKILEKITDLGL